MSKKELHLSNPLPAREDAETKLKLAQQQVDSLKSVIAALDAQQAQEEEAARQATYCPALAEVMKRLDEIEEAIKAISIFQFPTTITTPGTVPYVPQPWKPYVPWWETNKIWCHGNVGEATCPPLRVTYVGTDFDGEY